MLVAVTKEHSLRLTHLSAGAEETIPRSPTSESRHAPQRDKVVREGKLFDDFTKVERTM